MGGAIRFLMLLTVTPTPSPFLHHRYASLLRLSRHRPPLRSSVSCLSHRHLPSSISPSHSCPSKIKASHQLHTQTASIHFTDPSSSSLPLASHPWPEWSNFINNLWAAGYFNRQRFSINLDEEFVAGVNLPEDFVAAASACLAYARERPDLLGMLSRRDIEVVVERGMPFLFKNGDDSVRRMRLFLDSGYSNVQSNERAHTVDLMRFLLSYASNCVSSGRNNPSNGELVESSVLNVLNELAQLSNAPETNLSGSVQNQFPDRYGQVLRHIGAPQTNPYGSVQNQSLDRYGQAARPVGQNIEMKRGDWICPRCSFMNFARNMKCLECEEARPKRQLTGGEWECPQCDFFNYGRNTVCLRCDCKRPGEVSLTTNNSGSGLGYDYGSSANKAAVDSRLAANEEKAQRWFSKISQLDSNSDMSSAIEDEGFPEIMPLRKGVNRFVVSTRKTPLERRLANAQDRRNLANDGTSESSSPNVKPDQTVNQSLQNAGANTTHSASNITTSHAAPSGSNFIPFVPLPADMFANIPDKSKIDENEAVEMDNKSLASITDDQRGVFSGNNGYGKSSDSWQPSEKPPSNEREKEQAEKSERWFKRAAELHNVTDLASAISDEDFPEIMPMQKGENRFVVSKRKDRSLTSPMYKRRMAMEQANDTNFVPFVPFPPNYFAQKDKQQPDEADLTDNTLSETSNSAALENIQQLDDSGSGVSVAAHDQGKQNRKYSEGSIGSRTLENSNKSKAGASSISENSTQNVVDLQPSGRDSWSSGYSRTRSDNFSETPNMVENSSQNFTETSRSGKESRSNGFSAKEETSGGTSFTGTTSENQNVRGSWSGKSLEGSAVKEPDPLDMSEEAKAERWFRRVAQIKDISELSQIPDEDFPSIMPMRKGVNRFVVSKRKTPLERRLTSTQYRRNLPIVNSDPVKENDTADES